MKKAIAVLLVAAISAGSIALPTSSAYADHRRWSERSWDDGYDRGDRYYRDRGRDDDRYHRRDRSGSNHKKRDAAIIAGIAGLALGAAIVGSLNRQQAPANGDRLIYDPNY